MRIRALLLAALSGLLTVVLVPTAGATEPAATPRGCHHCVDGIPAGIPALTQLARVTPSATVQAGEDVAILASFVNVFSRPSAELTYRGPGGRITTVPFDTNTSPFSITVPADWRPGLYKLIKVSTSNEGGSTQYRNHRLVGTSIDGQRSCGRSDLDLRLMDLRVVAP